MVPPGAPRPVWADTRWMPLLAGAKRRSSGISRLARRKPETRFRTTTISCRAGHPHPRDGGEAFARPRGRSGRRRLVAPGGPQLPHRGGRPDAFFPRPRGGAGHLVAHGGARVVASVARNVCPKPTTARALLASRASEPTTADPSDVPRAANQVSAASGAPSTSGGPAFVRSHLPALDDALGGGVPTGSISELVGPAGAGKTQLCLTLAVATAAPPSAGGLGAGVVFVDTEQKFSAARLAEIARAKFPAVYGDRAGDQAAREALRRLTSRVLVLTPSTLSEILQRLNGLEEALIDHGVRLLVVDSMAALARAEFGHGQLTRRQELLGQIAAVLKRKAERLHMAAFVTNQVTTRLGRAATAVGGAGGSGADGGDDEGGGSTTAALGTKWAHCVNTRVVMEGAAEAAGGSLGIARGVAETGHQGGQIAEVRVGRFRVRRLGGGRASRRRRANPRAPLGRKRRRRHSKPLHRKRVVTRADETRETRADERTSGRASGRAPLAR